MSMEGMTGDRVAYTRGRAAVLVVLAALAAGCQEMAEPSLPTPEQIAAYYEYEGGVRAQLNGNVAEITIAQPSAQLRRGGTLWAKVGPYVLLFSQQTRELFQDHPGLQGVRVITTVAGGPEVARALLPRNELTDVLWRRGLNIAGRARLEGTDKPALLDALVRWGEDHTQYQYNERYTKR